MYTNIGICISTWHVCHVEDEVSDLPVEVVLIRVPVVAAVGVRVTVNQSNALEAGAGLESRDRDGITNQLSVVILDNWRAEKVGTRREVNESWSGCALSLIHI